MGRKVTDFKVSFISKNGQNFKNQSFLYNNLLKFSFKRLNYKFCLYNIYINPLYFNKQQQYYNYNYSKNIVPIVELKYLTRKNCLFSEESVVLCCKVQLNINVTHKYLVLFVFDKVLCIAWSAVPPAPKNVSELKFSALIHKIRTSKAYPARLRFLPNKEIFAFVLGNRSVINVVYNSDKCSVRFLEHTRRCKFEDEPIHRGTCHIAKFLHKLLRYHLALGLSIAFNLRGGRSVSAFTRSAVNEMRKHCFFENLDYMLQCIFALRNLVTEISSIFPTSLVFLDALPLVGKCNKTLITFRNVEMTCLVCLSQSKQFASLGVADITKGHNLVWAWVENLGVFVGHSDSNIEGIRFVITFGLPKVINQIFHDEVVCSLAVYHLNRYKNIPCKSHCGRAGLYAGYRMTLFLKVFIRYPFTLPPYYTPIVTIAPQKYNDYLKRATSVNYILTFVANVCNTGFRRIAAMFISLIYNYIRINDICKNANTIVVLNVVGSSPTVHPTRKSYDYQLVMGFRVSIIIPIPP